MKIAILGAMQEEIDLIIAQLDQVQSVSNNLQNYVIGQQQGHTVAVMLTGIGKVNAAINTASMIRAFQPDAVLNTGSAGGLAKDFQVGDIVIAKQLSYHDVDNRFWDYEYGQVPRMPSRYEVTTDLMNLAIKTGKGIPEFKTHVGLVTSGDSFIASEKQRQEILSHFPDVSAIDMESCAVAQVCYALEQPYIIVRAISDAACDDAKQDHLVNLDLCAKHLAVFVKNYLIHLE